MGAHLVHLEEFAAPNRALNRSALARTAAVLPQLVSAHDLFASQTDRLFARHRSLWAKLRLVLVALVVEQRLVAEAALVASVHAPMSLVGEERVERERLAAPSVPVLAAKYPFRAVVL